MRPSADYEAPERSGARVKVHGLVSSPQLNGCLGYVGAWIEPRSRFIVYVDGKKLPVLLKARNLQPADPTDGSYDNDELAKLMNMLGAPPVGPLGAVIGPVLHSGHTDEVLTPQQSLLASLIPVVIETPEGLVQERCQRATPTLSRPQPSPHSTVAATRHLSVIAPGASGVPRQLPPVRRHVERADRRCDGR